MSFPRLLLTDCLKTALCLLCFTLTPKRLGAGQLYSEGAWGTHALRHQDSRRARDKLISVLVCNMRTFGALFPSLAPPRNAKVGRPCLPHEGCQDVG